MPIDKQMFQSWRKMARRDDWHTAFVGSDIRLMLAEVERLKGKISEAHAALTKSTRTPEDRVYYVTALLSHEIEPGP